MERSLNEKQCVIGRSVKSGDAEGEGNRRTGGHGYLSDQGINGACHGE